MMLMVRGSAQLPAQIQQQVATIPGLQQVSKVKPSAHRISLGDLNPPSSPASSSTGGGGGGGGGNAPGLRRLQGGGGVVTDELPDDIQQQLQAMSASQPISSILPAAEEVSLVEINAGDQGAAGSSSGLSSTNVSNRRRLAAAHHHGVVPLAAHHQQPLAQKAVVQGQSLAVQLPNIIIIMSSDISSRRRRQLLWPVAHWAELLRWAHSRGSQDEKDNLLQLNFTTTSKQQPVAVTRAVTLADLNSLGRRALLAGAAGGASRGGGGGGTAVTGGRDVFGLSSSSSSSRTSSSSSSRTPASTGRDGTGGSSSEPTGQAEKAIKDSFGDVVLFNRPRKGTLATLCDGVERGITDGCR
jgi:hypothetical protein